MRVAIFFVILVAISGVAFVGPAFAMNEGDNGAGDCFSTLAQRAGCPAGEGSLASLNFHFGAFKAFMEFFVSIGIWGILALIFFSVLSGVACLKLSEICIEFSKQFRPYFSPGALKLKQTLLNWLRLFEQSPAVSR